MPAKDPTDGVPGYTWNCSNCSSSPGWLFTTMWFVKTFINPAQAMPSAGKKATIYCASCPIKTRLHCTACAGKLHSVGTKTQHHSLEAIDPTQSCGIYFFAPLLDLLFLPTLLFVAVLMVGVPSDYLSGKDICPIVHGVRRQLYHFDTGVTYMVKDKFAWACNMEDGYFRLIIDTWVRGITTETDNFLLIASAYARSLVFQTVAIKFLILPVLVLLNVVWSMAFHLILKVVARFMPDGLPTLLGPRAQQFMLRANGYLQGLIDQFVNPSNLPPPTLPRLRPKTDIWDGYNYWTGRYTRLFEYFFTASASRLQLLSSRPLMFAVGVRVLCMTTSIGYYIRRLCFLPGDVVASQAYAEVPVDALGHAIDKLSEQVLRRYLMPTAFFVVPHVPVAFIICGTMLYYLIKFPKFKNWLDTRNYYGGKCGKAPMTDVCGKCRWFPKTFEPVVE